MQTITTRYLGPTNHHGSRVKATHACGIKTVTLPWRSEYNEDHNHAIAAAALKKELGWSGVMVGGSTKYGMVWVFVDGTPRIE